MDVVSCPECREENPAKFRLCGFCGASLAPPETVLCPSCGEENPGKFRLCGYCGTALHGAATPPAAAHAALAVELEATEVRKPVTFIFVDLKGSTALTERIDQEAMNEIKKRYFTVMAAQIEQHGGTIEKYIGDAIMAVFGIPKAHEDDALRAVRAAHGMQQELVRLNEEFLRFYGVELANRTGVNTGEVVANTDPTANQQLATGDTVNVAARLEQAAPPNEILIGETTYDLVRSQVEVEPVEPLELKGKAERVPAYRLVAIRSVPNEAAAVASDAPLVGRDVQMDQLRASLAAVVSSGGCRIATVIGEAGVGKSYLVDTFGAQIDATTTVLRGRCLPYGEGITFWPLLEIARCASGIVEEDTPEVALAKLGAAIEGQPGASDIIDRVASVMGLSPSRYPVAEIFWGARKYLEAVASRLPVVVIIEDVHFAEPTFLDLLEHVRDSAGQHVAILIIVTGRLELLEKRPTWGDAEGTTLVTMSPLGPEDTGRLIEAILDGQVADAVRSRLVGSAEGNPLFVSQLLSMLVDKGVLRWDGELWTAADDLAELSVPPSIQALLAARLDDLAREERAILEPASVIGLAFPQPAVAELVPPSIRASVPGHLNALDRKQFVGRQGAAEGEDEIYRFRNLLIRDATYGSLLKRARAQMHERFASWAEAVNRERGREQEFEEILGYHLEQAYRYRTELGPIGDEGRSIAGRAADKLGAAGRRAFARGDLPAAASLLRRAGALLPEDSTRRIELFGELAEALVALGSFDDAAGVIEEGHGLAERLGDPRLVARMEVIRLLLGLYVASGESSASRSIAKAREIIRTLEPLDDDAGLARAWRVVMANEFTVGHLSEAAVAADRVVEHATRAGDQRLASRSAPAISYALVQGPTPVSDAIPRCEELLDSIKGDRGNEAIVLSALAQLRAMEGRFDVARSLYRRGQMILDELGGGIAALSTSIDSARVELRAGDLAVAEAELRRDDVALAAIDEAYFRSTITAMLANVLCTRGEYEQGFAFSQIAERLADEDDVSSQVAWRMARAKALGVQGDTQAAHDLGEEALGLAAGTEDLALRVETLIDHADLLVLLDRLNEAEPPLREALDLCERKGDVALAAQLRSRLGGLAEPVAQ